MENTICLLPTFYKSHWWEANRFENFMTIDILASHRGFTPNYLRESGKVVGFEIPCLQEVHGCTERIVIGNEKAGRKMNIISH